MSRAMYTGSIDVHRTQVGWQVSRSTLRNVRAWVPDSGRNARRPMRAVVCATAAQPLPQRARGACATGARRPPHVARTIARIPPQIERGSFARRVRWARGGEMTPFVPRTRAAAAIPMKQIVLDNQSRTIRCLRAKLATDRRESAATKEGLENKLSSRERELQIQRCDNHSLRNMVTLYHKDIDRRISQLVEERKSIRAKKQQARESHLECHKKWQAHIQQAQSMIQEQHLTIETLMEENTSLLQTIQGLQGNNGAPFDDEWEEDPEEEGLEEIPVGEGEIVDE
ncbi:kinesin-like calmodulin-binding protein [Dorcoceras hygrometricum]|uniref:Kinesin-like calmodulin-binding protein n=1 Tax=Dorcoceras hygrometricum TaxID=472368 RepID=A0A2Z7AF46_9LAMI|nr:kinesin-like calmodulin-binding protein [Dorcoceras hygrometricum]